MQYTKAKIVTSVMLCSKKDVYTFLLQFMIILGPKKMSEKKYKFQYNILLFKCFYFYYNHLQFHNY